MSLHFSFWAVRQEFSLTRNYPDQIAAAIEAFFWPKIFWDFLTKNLDGAVKPFPVLQIINIVMGLVGLAWEWPISFLAGSGLHRSIEARLIIYPISALVALLIYQGTNAGLYYIIGMMAYFWAYSEGEVRSIHYPQRHLKTHSNIRIDCLPRAMDPSQARLHPPRCIASQPPASNFTMRKSMMNLCTAGPTTT